MLDVLHGLPLQQWIIFRIGALVWRCIHIVYYSLAPAFPPRSLLSHPGHQRSQFTPLFVPFARTSTTQARASSLWNGLPLAQRLLPRILSDTFYSSLKTLLLQGSE